MNVAATVLTFREGLEAALIVAIVLTYLRRTGRASRAPSVWLGAGTAALLTIVFIAALQALGATFTYPAQGIYEGVTSLLAVAMVTSMTFWMARQGRQIKLALEHEVQEAVDTTDSGWQRGLGLFGVAFLAVAREGIETGLFLAAAAFASSGTETLIGGLVGLAAAVVVAWLVYAAGVRLDLRRFFRVSGILLIFFGAAMLRYAVQEFEEVGIVPPLIERVWNAGAWLPDNEGIGAVLAALVGYSAHPSLAQVLAYVLYFAAVILALAWPSLRQSASAAGDLAPARPRRRPWLVFSTLCLVAAASLVLGGCGLEQGAPAASGPAPEGGEVKIVARDNVFDPKDVHLPAGKPVRVTFANEGKNVHEPEIKGLIGETKLVAGQSKSYDVTAKPGTYRLYCEIHEGTMEGTVTVA